MSDPGNPRQYTDPGAPPGADPGLRKVGDDLRNAAREAREAGSQAASTISAEASAAAGTLKREGAALLDTAKERAASMADDGKRAGAEQAQGLARAIHRAADDLEAESPELARVIHDAAGTVDGMARALRDRSPAEMLRGAEDFARSQPMFFFGAAALAGFALTRFARASATHRHAHMQDGQTEYPRAPAVANTAASALPGHRVGEDGATRPATLASASLGGAAAYRPPSADQA